MPDKNKQATDKPVKETKVEDVKTEEPKIEEVKVQETKVEEPKVEQPDSGTAAPVGDGAESAGTDQQGRQLYSVKCAKCGKQAQVPFKPSGDRPVYCRDCYMEQRMGGGQRV